MTKRYMRLCTQGSLWAVARCAGAYQLVTTKGAAKSCGSVFTLACGEDLAWILKMGFMEYDAQNH
ncbi:MAG: hypothetical protein EAX95_14225 [Candidatus Thorarchaeota archaeon]|nr:hypothetical protein [Candidatus Thorarchaeota archaeon]